MFKNSKIWMLIFFVLLTSCQSAPPPDPALPGSYQVGVMGNIFYKDSSREGRAVSIYLWYPAIIPEDAPSNTNYYDVEPDKSGAPYPLIVMSKKSGDFFASHLASHGFVVIGVEMQDSSPNWGKWLIDYPADQVFALEQFAASPQAGFEEIIDGENAGAAGYSFDGYDALALSGARIDPAYYLKQCQEAVPAYPEPEDWWIDYVCNMSGGWEEFEAYASALDGDSPDELWQPITSPRIKAVMPMAPEGAWLFGPRGLAAADRPALILDGTEDDINYYQLETVTIFEQIGSEDKTLISFTGKDHFMIFDEEQVEKMSMLATAFFSYHLKDEEAYLTYFSEEFINTQPDLVWGVYP